MWLIACDTWYSDIDFSISPIPEIFSASPWDCQHSWGNFGCTWQRISIDTYINFTQYYWLVITQPQVNVALLLFLYVCCLLQKWNSKAFYYFPGQSKHQVEDTVDCKLFVNFVVTGCYTNDHVGGWLVNYHHLLSMHWGIIQWLKCPPVSITSSSSAGVWRVRSCFSTHFHSIFGMKFNHVL